MMIERFGKDTVIALATIVNGVPFVRKVNAYYENGAYCITTYVLSNKIKYIGNNPTVTMAGDWFTAHEKTTNRGSFGKKKTE